jgi:hypothetical protein
LNNPPTILKAARVRSVSIGFFAVLVVANTTALALPPRPAGDTWLTNAAPWPEQYAHHSISSNVFTSLHAEAIAGKFQVSFDSQIILLEPPRVVASADAPGHWPARDWRSYKMRRAGNSWVVEVPVDNVDVPVIYFVVSSQDKLSRASPMRIARPRELGLEQPTRFFWPFIEGFEEGHESWRVDGEQPLHISEIASHGRAALAVTIPRGKRSVTVLTTRLRGWFLEEHNASGVALRMRTKTGDGTASFTLLSNALSTNQIVSKRLETTKVSRSWKSVELPFSTFPDLSVWDVDLFAIQLSAQPGTEFLIDDVYLMGRWGKHF